MKEVEVDVIGTKPPCSRCRTTEKNAEKAASRIRENGIKVRVKKVSILSKEVVSKYGVLVTPALAVNGVVKTMGRVPDEKEIENILRKAVE